MQTDSKWQPEQSQGGSGLARYSSTATDLTQSTQRKVRRGANQSHARAAFRQACSAPTGATPLDPGQPRTRTSLKLTSTRPPACGRPKLNCGRERGKSIT